MNDVCSKCKNKKLHNCDKCGVALCRQHWCVCDYAQCGFSICDDCGKKRYVSLEIFCPKHADKCEQ